MYEQVFKLDSRPFTLAPYVKHYFAAESMHHALLQTRMCIDRASGPVIIVGGTGTGKSLLLAMIAEQYPSEFKVVNLPCTRLNERHDLLQAILFELKLPYRDMSEGELRLSLNDHLKSTEHCPNGILLLIDEAHTLPVSLLDEVRLITNFVRDGQPLVRLVMAGNPGLEEGLINSKLESLNQRIAARCYLNHLKRNETQQYIVEHINRVGGNGLELFESEAISLIHEKSDGCPRVINQICDHALILAGSLGANRITEEVVIEAWNDVQCIPASRSRITVNPQRPAHGIHETGIEISTVFTSDHRQPNNSPGNDLPPEPIQQSDNESWNVVEFAGLQSEEKAVLDHATESDSDPGTTWEFGPVEDAAPPETESREQPRRSHVDKNKSNSAIEQRFNDERSIEEQLLEKHGLSGYDFHSRDANSDHDDQDAKISRAIGSVEQLSEEPQMEFHRRTDVSTDVSPEEFNGPQQDNVFENPFDESFLQEEQIVNEYAPEVAERNLASLGISRQQLQYLDQIRGDIVRTANHSREADSQPADQQAGTTETTASFNSTEFVVSSDEDLRLNENELRQVDAIHREVERIEQLSYVEMPFETPLNLNIAPPVSTPNLGAATAFPDGDEAADSGLIQRQRMLEEIRRHQSDLRTLVSSISKPISEHNYTIPESETTGEHECLPLEYPVASSNDANSKFDDDRDMLIISRIDQFNQNNDSVDGQKQTNLPTATSTGKAIRIDYDQLFEQLRSELPKQE